MKKKKVDEGAPPQAEPAAEPKLKKRRKAMTLEEMDAADREWTARKYQESMTSFRNMLRDVHKR